MADPVIWKYLIPGSSNELDIPKNSRLLSVGLKDKEIYLWALVDPEAEQESKIVHVFATGEGITYNTGALKFIGTVIDEDGLVWHVFEEVK